MVTRMRIFVVNAEPINRPFSGEATQCHFGVAHLGYSLEKRLGDGWASCSALYATVAGIHATAAAVVRLRMMV